jgi:hypothetical protein
MAESIAGMKATRRLRTLSASPALLVVEMGGHVTNELLADLSEHLVKALRAVPSKAVIVDTTPATGIDANVREQGFRVLTTLKENGAPFLVAVSQLTALRMLGSAVAFGARYPLQFVETLASAQKLVDEHNARPPRPPPTPR